MSTDGLVVPSDTTERLERIASLILSCQRTLKLYPTEHPRVPEALGGLENELRAFHDSCGRAFRLDSGEHGRDPEKSTEDRSILELVHLLRLSRVKKLVISPQVPARELFEFCTYLGIVSGRGSSDDDEDVERQLFRQQATWDAIKITFFEIQSASSSHPLRDLLNSAGMHRAPELEHAFNELPEKVRRTLQGELTNPSFLVKISLLRQALEKDAPPDDRGKKIDLFEEILHAAIPDGSKPGAFADDPDDDTLGASILKNVRSFTNFIESNLDSLATAIESYPSDGDRDVFRSQLRDAIQSETGTVSRAKRLQHHKQRLDFLFQTAEGAASPKKSASSTAKPGVEMPEPPVPAVAETTIPAATKDTDTILTEQDFTLNASSTSKLYLFVVLDLMHKGHIAQLMRRWPFVVETLERSVEEGDCVSPAIRELCEFCSETRIEEAEDLLFSLVEKLPNDDVLANVAELLWPTAGEATVRRLFERLDKRDFQRSVALLLGLRRDEEHQDLGDVARNFLLRRATNSEVLANWALEDSSGLLGEGIFSELLEQLNSEQVTNAFRSYFRRSDDEAACLLINDVPSRVQGSERVLFAAMDYGTSVVRLAAIRNLGRYRTQISVNTLTSLLNRNNTSDLFRADEVRAILTALLKMQTRAANSHLQAVQNDKKILFHVYSSEIRKILEDLLERNS